MIRLLLVAGALWIPACSAGEPDETQVISLHQIDTIHIRHGSTTLHVSATQDEELGASLIADDRGSGISFENHKGKLTIDLNRDVARLLNLGNMPELQIRIPEEFNGKVSVAGSSGQVHIKDWNAGELEVRGKSGGIAMSFSEILNPVNVTATSGNVRLTLDRPDAHVNWLLESSSGKRSVTFPLNNHEHTKRETLGQTGNGSTPVRIKTSSGSITVKLTDE
ncbi:DUF4097 domain-containing protein [Paenibacillus lactis]|uniref:DUF4097 domain-containing protein n=1 Tax=Paenibacillus lactis TaxID=228574 RepID=UPI0021B58A9B